MKRIIRTIFMFSLVFAFVACTNSTGTSKKKNKETVTETYNNEVVDPTYLKTKLSEATSIYYKSNDEGKFGDDNQVFRYSIMPEGYTELEYLESNGSQYIDTGVEYKNTLQVEITFKDYTSAVRTGGLFGSGSYLFSIYKNTASQLIFFNKEATYFTINNFSSKRKYTIKASANMVNMSGTNGKLNNNSGSHQAYGNMTIFKSYSGYASYKLYSFILKDGDTTIRNYVPARRDLDNELGLYDLENGVFYTNNNESKFVEKRNLPAGYTQVEYIESSGYNYIDSGLTVSKADEAIYDADIQMLSTETKWAGANCYLEYQYDYIQTLNKVNMKLHWLPDDQLEKIYIDGHFKNERDWSAYNINNVKIGIFRLGNSSNKWWGTPQQSQKARLYGLKITINDVLMRDFVPSYRNSDNEVGLYDMISNAFYTDLNSNAFNVGSPIDDNILPLDYQKVEYLESTGSQCINTKFTVDEADEDDTFTAIATVSSTDTVSGKRDFIYGFNNPNYSHYAEIYSDGKYGAHEAYSTDPLLSDTEYSLKMQITGGTKTEFFIDDTLSSESTTYQSKTWGTFNLFCIDNAYMANSVRISEAKLYYNGQLVRNLIPAVRKVDSIAGMYDLVQNQFYYDPNTTGLLEGKDVVVSGDYKQIEYLSISKGDTIDTGVFGGAIYDFDIEWKGDGTRQLMGYSGSSAEYFGVQEDGSYGIGWWNKTTYMAGNRDKLKWVFEENNVENGVYINGTRIVYSGYTDVSEEEFTIGNISKDSSFPCTFKLYGLKVTQNNALIRNFVPVYSVSEEKNGLYDIVNDVFYPSGSKMTEFIAGEELEYYDEGTVIKEASYKDEGEIVYHSLVSDKELHKIIKPYAHKVTIESDDGVKDISVCDGYDLSKCSKTNIAYTRNLNTNNYSTNGAFIMIKIELEEGYELYDNEGMLEKYNNHENTYMIENIHSNLTLQIRTRTKSE